MFSVLGSGWPVTAEEETLYNVEARLYKVMQLPPGLF